MIKSGELEISFSSQHTHILDCAHTHINAEMQRMLRYALSLVSANQSEPASSDACHKNTGFINNHKHIQHIFQTSVLYCCQINSLFCMFNSVMVMVKSSMLHYYTIGYFMQCVCTGVWQMSRLIIFVFPKHAFLKFVFG